MSCFQESASHLKRRGTCKAEAKSSMKTPSRSAVPFGRPAYQHRERQQGVESGRKVAIWVAKSAYRQSKPKRRAAVGVVAGADFAAVEQDQLVAYRQTQAGAFFAAGRGVAEARVFFEQQFLFFLRNAGAGIRPLAHDPVAVASGAYGGGAAQRRVLDGVAD